MPASFLRPERMSHPSADTANTAETASRVALTRQLAVASLVGLIVTWIASMILPLTGG